MLRGLEQHPEWDCVMGRFPRKRHSGWRNLGSRLMRWLNVQLLGAPPEITPSSFRVFRRVVAEALCGHGTAKPILSPLIFRTTRRIGNIDVEHHERRHGTSNYRFWQLVRILLDNVFTASTLPLRLMSGLGFSPRWRACCWRVLLAAVLRLADGGQRLYDAGTADHLLRRLDALCDRPGGGVSQPSDGRGPAASSLLDSRADRVSLSGAESFMAALGGAVAAVSSRSPE
jgi:hypothetical protein